MQGSFLAVLYFMLRVKGESHHHPLNGPCHYSHHSSFPTAHTLSSKQDKSCCQGLPFALSHFKHIPCPHQDTAYFPLGLLSHLPLTSSLGPCRSPAPPGGQLSQGLLGAVSSCHPKGVLAAHRAGGKVPHCTGAVVFASWARACSWG